MSGREAAAVVAGRRERTARGSKLIYYWRKREIKCSATAREIYGRGGGRWWRGLTCCQRSLLLRVTSLSGPSSIFSISVPRRSPPRAPGERGPWGEGAAAAAAAAAACPGFTIARGQTPASGPRARRVKQSYYSQVQRPKSRRAETESRARAR